MTKAGSRSVIICGGIDDLRPVHFRFFEEAAKQGNVFALLWSDDSIKKLTGKPSKFPLEERRYLLESIRYIHKVIVTDNTNPDALPVGLEFKPDVWAVDEPNDNKNKKAFCKTYGLKYHVLKNDKLGRFPEDKTSFDKITSSQKKVIVTGCYDWFHSGHVRFFEETSQLGDLYVSLGSDKTISEYKGKGHPMFPQEQRRFVCQSIRFVKRAFIASGSGWLDAEPEMYQLKPDIYVVNEDGDRPEKRDFCKKNNIEYVILKRLPKPGLARRQSTTLRGY
jgi:cytidyltransferase-like protein